MKNKLHDKCISCGKKLTIDEHRERGFGPECWNKVEKLELPIDFIEIRNRNMMLWASDCNFSGADNVVAQVVNEAEKYDDKFVVFSAWDVPYGTFASDSKSILLGHKKKLGIEIDEKLPNHVPIDPLKLRFRKYVPLAYIDTNGWNFEIVCHNDWEIKVSLLDASTAWYEPIFTNQTYRKFENADFSLLKKLIPKEHTVMFTDLVSRSMLCYEYFYTEDQTPQSLQELGDNEYECMHDEMFPLITELLLSGCPVRTMHGWGIDLNSILRSKYGSRFWTRHILEYLQNGKTIEDCPNETLQMIWVSEAEKVALAYTDSHLDTWDWDTHAREIWDCIYDLEYDIREISNKCFEKLFQAIRKY